MSPPKRAGPPGRAKPADRVGLRGAAHEQAVITQKSHSQENICVRLQLEPAATLARARGAADGLGSVAGGTPTARFVTTPKGPTFLLPPPEGMMEPLGSDEMEAPNGSVGEGGSASNLGPFDTRSSSDIACAMVPFNRDVPRVRRPPTRGRCTPSTNDESVDMAVDVTAAASVDASLCKWNA